MNRLGIDVSNNNGTVDWEKIAPHISFAFVKTTEGMTFKDSFCKENIQGARQHGVAVGPYHFASNENASGKAECNKFLETALAAGWGIKGDLPGVLDIEHGKGGRPGVRFVREFARQYKKRTGHRVIVYTGSFWRDVLSNPVVLAKSKLFLAAYTDTWHGWVPKAWKKPWIWQFTQNGTLPGLNGFVDKDRFLKSEKHFKEMKLKKNIRH